MRHKLPITNGSGRPLRLTLEPYFLADITAAYRPHDYNMPPGAAWSIICPNPEATMQVDIGDGRIGTNLVHFREIWTRACAGFLHSVASDARLIFTPELLRSEINYARVFCGPDGSLIEETDRWEQALKLCGIAAECMDAAQLRFST